MDEAGMAGEEVDLIARLGVPEPSALIDASGGEESAVVRKVEGEDGPGVAEHVGAEAALGAVVDGGDTQTGFERDQGRARRRESDRVQLLGLVGADVAVPRVFVAGGEVD